MNKQEFTERLINGLSCLPKEDMEERLSFYTEMIDDRMEEGYSEEEAVGLIGDVDEIIRQIIAEAPASVLVKKRARSQRKIKEMILIVLGSPIWLSLGLALLSVIFTLYIVLWSVIASLWAVFASLAACGAGLALWGAALCFAHGAIGAAVISSGLICSGVSLFLFLGCTAATKGILLLTKKLTVRIKNIITKKEEA